MSTEELRALHEIIIKHEMPNITSFNLIKSFRDDYMFLSNFYECDIELDGLVYANAESAFQAYKTLDMEERKQFIDCKPGTSKKLGRKVKLRDDWEDIKCGVMFKVLYNKFTQNPELKQKLVDTYGYLLVEGNNWNDCYWGISNRTGNGKNRLGMILMLLRREFMKN